MIGVIINNNLDVLLAQSLNSIDKISPIIRTSLQSVESNLISYQPQYEEVSEIYRFEGEDAISSTSTYGFSSFHTNPIPRVKCILFREEAPVLIGKALDYKQLKGIYARVGALNFSRLLKLDGVKSYVIEPPKHVNQLLVDSDPFEFVLIQNGLERIERHPFEPDSFNTLSNQELWEMYLTNERVDIYEYDSLLK